jgi:hypothetical protein
MTLSERVSLTAGSIWHYLSENGASPVAKLVLELPGYPTQHRLVGPGGQNYPRHHRKG